MIARLALAAAAWWFACGCYAADVAIVVRDQAPLRAEPRDSARQHAVLWQGEAVEVRGERMDYLVVYDHRRERGGYVRAAHVRKIGTSAHDASELRTVIRFLRDTSGTEALGIGYVAAFIQAAPSDVLRGEPGAEALDALGAFAERLAWRASSGEASTKAAEAALSAHLDVAARYGVAFTSFESEGRVRLCYEGDAFRRVLATGATPPQRARAALALTRPECTDPSLRPDQRAAENERRAELLERIDVSALPGYLRNRVLMRRASLWSAMAYQRARKGEPSDVAASRAVRDLTGVSKADLTDSDKIGYEDAAMRVNASRWAATPATPAARGPQVAITTRAPGETCVALSDSKRTLVQRCTYGIVWPSSATVNREGTALALSVQQTETWTELWVFRKSRDAWVANVLPPAALAPDLGYAEFAGWVPGGKQMLVAREARSEGKYRRTFEVLHVDTLGVQRQASDPSVLGAFKRWQDPAWKTHTVSLR